VGDAHFPLHLISGNYEKIIAQQLPVDNDMLVSLQKNIALLKRSSKAFSSALFLFESLGVFAIRFSEVNRGDGGIQLAPVKFH